MKKKMFEEYEVKIPVWALSYIVNGDSSALTDEDIAMVDEALEREPGTWIPGDGEAYFTSWPEFGLPCDVVDGVILVDDDDDDDDEILVDGKTLSEWDDEIGDPDIWTEEDIRRDGGQAETVIDLQHTDATQDIEEEEK